MNVPKSTPSATGLGHWETAAADGKQIFCIVSGGYVLVGVRASKSSYEVSESSNARIDTYNDSHPIRPWIRKNLGDKALDEVDTKVKHLIAIRNKATAAPGKE
eukprot:TRINITY_DN349_c1_g1_i2.p2 TRINITY_DN349_c1_g1~~TRINITY_DN349_c1_g1_i2.p2  ORF type:complete len:103 (+),score=16.40 TRINITY_DN349_c1_g1_i2:371-679(+)